MVKRTFISFIFGLALFSGFALFAAEGITTSGGATSGDVSFNIRYFDKRIYHAPGNASSLEKQDPIFVLATITNSSPATYRFKLADERAFSIEFDVRTITNRAVEPANVLIRRRTTSSQIFFREIAVESGESFSFVEDLRNYADLQEPGAFVVKARIYPELFRPELSRGPLDPQGAVIESNRLSLSLRPPAIPGPDGVPVAMDTDSGLVLSRERLAPDEVVEYLITARQKSQWEKFFLYLDLEEIISRDPVRRRQWITEGEEGRRRMITLYREEMQQSVIDGDITAIPSEFEIERTNYNAQEGTVVVLEKFRTGTNYTERKRYTYYLKRKEDHWAIIDYVVANLGTE
ncbi:MAG: hypothetical protein LBT39_08765 [Treponema sp.]|jgi:hypothetical protein|nr:hypothetical protein [Treponema sp.]